MRQRRREQSLATVAEFYRLYGEFFALWKLCNYAFRGSDVATTDDMLWDLMRRAAALEASGEAILLRITTELRLSDDEIRTLEWAVAAARHSETATSGGAGAA